MNIPLNIDWQQILLHLMNFVILAGGLYFLLSFSITRNEESFSLVVQIDLENFFIIFHLMNYLAISLYKNVEF